MPRLETVTAELQDDAGRLMFGALAVPIAELYTLCCLLLKARGALDWAGEHLQLAGRPVVAEQVAVEIGRLDAAMGEAAARLQDWHNLIVRNTEEP